MRKILVAKNLDIFAKLQDCVVFNTETNEIEYLKPHEVHQQLSSGHVEFEGITLDGSAEGIKVSDFVSCIIDRRPALGSTKYAIVSRRDNSMYCLTDLNGKLFYGDKEDIENYMKYPGVSNAVIDSNGNVVNRYGMEFIHGEKFVEQRQMDRAASKLKFLESFMYVKNGYVVGYNKEVDAEVKKLMIPKGVIGFAKSALEGCKLFDEIILPEGCTQFEDACFAKTSIKQIEIPNGTLKISRKMFFGCGALQTVKLPVSCTMIEAGAFGFCKSLKTLEVVSRPIFVARDMPLGLRVVKRHD